MDSTEPNPAFIAALERRAEREKSARKAAEKLLEEKALELYSANEALLETQTALKLQIQTVEQERDRIEQVARTDTLTQLLTRGCFLKQLDASLARHIETNKPKSRRELWLIVIRLKRFKRVNELLGQHGADHVLQVIAQRLTAFISDKAGVVARYSGTEFALFYETEEIELQSDLKTLCAQIDETIRVGERDFIVEYAIAGAGSKLAGHSVDSLRNAVDRVLSKVRRSDRTSIMIYDEAQRDDARFRKQIEDEIKISITRQEFIPWFQPILYSRDSRHICLEALARWPKHGGIIRPDQFIPVANDLGLWQDIDKQLFATACTQVKPLIDSGQVKDLSINVSPLQLIMPDFIRGLQHLLARAEFPASNLILEITEEVLIEDIALIHAQIQRLHELGIKIAVDDFGTGYSNLKNLIGLPIDAVKIDRSLVMDIERDNRATMLISTLVQWASARSTSRLSPRV